jgi:oligopeptidase B
VTRSGSPLDPARATLRARLAQEQRQADAVLAPLTDVAAQVAARLEGSRARTTASVPYRVGDHWYVRRRVPGRAYPQICRLPARSWTPPRPPGPHPRPPGWQVVVDGTGLAAQTGYADVAELAPGPDGRLVAFTVDTAGAEHYDLVVLDVRAGREVDRVRGVSPRFAWWPDGSALAYTTVDDTLRPDRVLVHRLGTRVETDVVAVREPDASRWLGVGTSTSGRLLLVLSGSASSTEWLRLDGPPDRPAVSVLLPREDGVQHQVEHARLGGEDVLLVLHTEPGRADRLLARRGLAGDAPSRTLLTGHDRLQLLHLSASAAAVVLNVREDGLPCARVYRACEASSGALPGPLVAIESALAARPQDWWQSHVRVTRLSWVAAPRQVDVEVSTGVETVLRDRTEVGGPDPLVVQRLEVTSSIDGVRVPLTVIGRSDAARPGPLLLTVYGAYGQCQDPALDTCRAELLERGVRVAVAHVRGGGELGPAWHDAGRGRAKQTTFTDLLDCARFLLDDGWTTRDGLVAQGTSAGGLAVAVAANQAPQLFAGVVALVPFVDPLTSMDDPTRPLTTLEHAEWGDPRTDPAVRAAVAAYSPVQNVRRLPYPPMFVTTAEHDWRADPAHVLEWVDRLRAAGTARGPVVLRAASAGGHAGPTHPGDLAREQALRLAWILHTSGAC